MKLKVKTTTLQAMFSKVYKAANQNKLIPLTSFVNIKKEGTKLILTATNDMEIYFYSIANNVEGEDFYVTVGIEQIYKLISKMTCENITLELKQNTLEVVGNGRYSVEIPMDETGEIIQFPDPYRDIHPEDTEDIEFTDTLDYSEIQKILGSVKSSLATTMEYPVLINYYLGDFVCATDKSNVTSYDARMFETPELLISPKLMNLLALLTQESIDVKITDDYMLFVTDDAIIYSDITTDVEDYPAKVVASIVSQELPNSCKIAKNKLLALLDRISIFVSEYDLNVIHMTFDKASVQVATTNSGSDEVLEYVEKNDAIEPFDCKVDIVSLTEHVKSCTSDTIQIEFGIESCIKIVDGDITKVIMLFE